MNRILLFAALILVSFIQSFGQSKRYIHLEHFTNTRCSSCGSINPGFYNVISGYEGSYHHMTIHPSFPYSSCALYQANISENTARTNFYGVTGTPTVVMNGGVKRGASQISSALLTQELAKTSPIEIRVKEIGTMSRSVTVEIKVTGTRPSANYKIYVAAAEKELNFASPNGERLHHNVFRKFVSAVDGEAITLPAEGSSIILNFNYTVSSTWVESQMYALVWVLDAASKEILNSGTKFDPVTTSVEESSIPGFKIYPNPVKDQVNVRFESGVNAQTAVAITNIFGKELKNSSLKSGATSYSIPVAELPKGIYFIRFSANGKSVTRKWFKD